MEQTININVEPWTNVDIDDVLCQCFEITSKTGFEVLLTFNSQAILISHDEDGTLANLVKSWHTLFDGLVERKSGA